MSDHDRRVLTREEFEALPREERRRLIVSARDATLRATTADRTKARRRLANRRARQSRRANR